MRPTLLALVPHLVATFIFMAATSASHAQPTAVPTGLNSGDQYRLAFVTSTTITATSSDIATYSAFVTGVANTVAQLRVLGTTWTAIGSTATVDARDNTDTNPAAPGVPIYLLNDTTLAVNNTDLWDGDIANPVCVTETGVTLCPNLIDVWTGTSFDGFGLAGKQLGSATPNGGFGEVPSDNWIDATTQISSASLKIYGISAVLTAPDINPNPIPSLSNWFLLLLSGTLLLGIRRFGRRT
jgi:hypothetical protein